MTIHLPKTLGMYLLNKPAEETGTSAVCYSISLAKVALHGKNGKAIHTGFYTFFARSGI